MNATKQFGQYLSTHIRSGTVNLYIRDCHKEVFGEGYPQVEWIIHNPKILDNLSKDPIAKLGDSYIAGDWQTNEGGLKPLLNVLLNNLPNDYQQSAYKRLCNKLSHWWEQDGSRKIPQDITEDRSLLHSFLDQNLHLSAGYFTDPHVSLEEAQRAKCRHIMRKLCLEPGQRVLVIEDAWNPIALFLAEHSEAHITALINSSVPLEAVQQLAAKQNLQHRLTVLSEDIWQHRSMYDHIVTVGIIEKLSAEQFPIFFQQIKNLLHPEGIALLQTTGRAYQHRVLHPWIRKHSLFGGNYPSLSELTGAIEKHELTATDIEVLRFHYSLTLSAWQERFSLQRTELASRHGEHFCRLWEFCMAATEIIARRDIVVYQIQMAINLDTLPITRNYLYRSLDERASKIIVQPINGNLRINLRK